MERCEPVSRYLLYNGLIFLEPIWKRVKYSRRVIKIWIERSVAQTRSSIWYRCDGIFLKSCCWLLDSDTTGITIEPNIWNTSFVDVTSSSNHDTTGLLNELDLHHCWIILQIYVIYLDYTWYFWIITGSVLTLDTCWLYWTLTDRYGVLILWTIYRIVYFVW